MGWADRHIARLSAGETVKFRPHGSSMSGKIESGQLVTVSPADPTSLKVGDVVLCKVKGSQYLHSIKAIKGKNEEFLIGGYNRTFNNGWISANQVYGVCVQVED